MPPPASAANKICMKNVCALKELYYLPESFYKHHM